MENKKKGGGLNNLIKSFEDFKKVISKVVNIKVGEKDGKPIYNSYRVHAVSPKRLAEVRGNWNNAKPQYPKKSKDDDGNERNDPNFGKKLDKYRLDIEAWSQTEVCYLVLAGWVEPEGIEGIVGKTDREKAEFLFENAGVVGHLNILSVAIEDVSALSGADVNFM